MTARLKLTETQSEINAKILFVLAEKVNAILKGVLPTIEGRSKIIVDKYVRASPVMESLNNGKLMADFGLTIPLALSAMEEIVQSVVNNMRIDFIKSKKIDNAIWSFTLYLLPNEYLYNIIKSGSYHNTGKSGGEIDWLEWLMAKGTQIVIGGYHVYYKANKSGSRSKLAIMLEDKTSENTLFNLSSKRRFARTGGGDNREDFRVDPEFAGTIEDNFITRAIELAKPEIREVIRSVIESKI